MTVDDAQRYDVVVIGAGPAGMAAAAGCAGQGLATLLLDEQQAPGGQIYRGITGTPVRERRVLGGDYWHGQELVERLSASDARVEQASTVWSVLPDEAGEGWQVGVSRAGRARLVRARRVVVATGALERPFPVPGWTLPGVMTAGAAQILLKTAGLAPAGRVVLAGTGPLLYLLAAQLARAGAKMDLMLDTTPGGRWRSAWRHAPGFLLSPYLAKGLAIYREAVARVPVIRGVTAVEALGGEGLARVRYARGGRSETVAADTLLLHQGVIPNTNLTRALGCAHDWDPAQRCFVVRRDAWGAASVPGVSVAGDGAAIGGARVAEIEGGIAALGAACGLGAIDAARRDALAAPLRRELARWGRGRAFIDAMYLPGRAFLVPEGDTIVCSCEEVTAAQVAEAARLGAAGPNQVKSFLRCGMGPCQGRLCGATVTEIIASVRRAPPGEVGAYRTRFPVKPLTLGELAAMPQTPASVQAVVRLPAAKPGS